MDAMWIILIIAVVLMGLTAVMKRRNRAAAIPSIKLMLYTGVLRALALGLSVAFVVMVAVSWIGGGSSASEQASTKPVPADNGGAQVPAGQPEDSALEVPGAKCKTFKVKLDANRGNRVMGYGLRGTPEQARAKILRVARQDPRIFQLYWNSSPLGKKQPVASASSLVKGGCYTTQAQEMYFKWSGAFLAAKVKRSAAPSYGTNTGAYPGGRAFTETGPISGNRAGYKFTYGNGDKIWVMHRCGNVVTKTRIPGVKPKPRPGRPVSPRPGSPRPQVGQPGQPTPGVPVTRPPKCGQQQGRFCGTPLSGPDFQDPQHPPQSVAGASKPTPGYTPGNAEAVHQVQQPGSGGDPSGNSSTPKGTDTGSPQGGSPGQTGGDNGDYSGGSSTVTNDPTPPPDQGSTSGDPCGGDPNCGGN